MGSYVIALWLPGRRNLTVGRLGAFDFPAGWYLYAGSAFGPGGLQARLARHRRRAGATGRAREGAVAKRAHWHVDYLREEAIWCGAWASAPGQRVECDWAAGLSRLPGAQIIAPGFGSSDCGCPAHLVHVTSLPSERVIAATLGADRLFMGEEELQELLQALTAANDATEAGMERRETAALALGRYGDAALEHLERSLGLRDADIRWWATRALAEVGGDGAVQLLVQALGDIDPDVRACAALALGRAGAAPAAPVLTRALGDESAFVASIAGDALAMLGEPAIVALVDMLADDSAHVRLLAVRALGRIRSRSAIEPLLGLLEDPSYLVRYYAQDALEALGVGMVFLKP